MPFFPSANKVVLSPAQLCSCGRPGENMIAATISNMRLACLALLALVALPIVAQSAFDSVLDEDSTGKYARDFWSLRTATTRGEAYYFALILYPRLTLMYMYFYDQPAVPVLLNEPSTVSLLLFGAGAPHLLAAYNFYRYERFFHPSVAYNCCNAVRFLNTCLFRGINRRPISLAVPSPPPTG